MLAEMASQELILKSAEVLRQEAEYIGLPGKRLLSMLNNTRLDREESSAWRDVEKKQAQADAQKIQANVKMVQMKIQAEANAQRIQAEKRR